MRHGRHPLRLRYRRRFTTIDRILDALLTDRLFASGDQIRIRIGERRRSSNLGDGRAADQTGKSGSEEGAPPGSGLSCAPSKRTLRINKYTFLCGASRRPMPDFFKFQATSDYIIKGLTQQEIAGVGRWQATNLDYDFSFHTQHEAGHPCYLVEPDGPRRNLPKINLKIPGNLPLIQGSSVRDIHRGADFQAVIRANTPLFQKLAAVFYAEAVRKKSLAKWVVQFNCSAHTNRWPTVLRYRFPEELEARVQPDGNQISYAQTVWPNFKHRTGTLYRKPICKWHGADCMIDTLVLLPAESLQKLDGFIEDDGELITSD
jgi:hypothetical protein